MACFQDTGRGPNKPEDCAAQDQVRKPSPRLAAGVPTAGSSTVLQVRIPILSENAAWALGSTGRQTMRESGQPDRVCCRPPARGRRVIVQGLARQQCQSALRTHAASWDGDDGDAGHGPLSPGLRIDLGAMGSRVGAIWSRSCFTNVNVRRGVIKPDCVGWLPAIPRIGQPLSRLWFGYGESVSSGQRLPATTGTRPASASLSPK